MKKHKGINTPSEFYRIRRPENFSDSEISYEIILPREHLAHELSQLSTNQKQDEFEILCRRLCEIYVTPNLIPQVGPTGGGDGKTDSETYPVSNSISDRWFIPENGWKNEEKWAFAISAKKTWKSKAKSDINKIIGTKRGYTRVYFLTNQTPSSKKKKDAQDEFEKEFNIEVVILDGEWILEKVINNNHIDLVVDSLNLSDVYKKNKVILGKNDADRKSRLSDIEKNIVNPNRYFEHDLQLVEDCIESAILSRQLELPREEVEGKFDRALRFCKKINNNKQKIRIHYQRAWTYLNWYDDYEYFIEEYKIFKEYISNESSISEVELYFNLVNLLRGLSTSNNCKLSDYDLNLEKEKLDLYETLTSIENNKNKPCSSLIASTLRAFFNLLESHIKGEHNHYDIKLLSKNMAESKRYIDFPFETFKKMIEEIGGLFPSNEEFDDLIDILAPIAEARNSQLSSGEMFLRRGGQKLLAKYYKESIIYFGKAVLKLAKNESKSGMYLALMGLSQAYNSLGLIWASNNCLISASVISFRSWYENGVLNERIYSCTEQLAINELYMGRIPSFLIWYELLQVISTQINSKISDISPESLMDGCLSVRLLNSSIEDRNETTFLPDLFGKYGLWISQDASLYKLGYTQKILNEYKEFEGMDIHTEDDLLGYFKKIVNQPFRKQMIGETKYLASNSICLSSIILGCKFSCHISKDKELLLATETILAFLESFFSSSLTDVYPQTDSITINISRHKDIEIPKFHTTDNSYEFNVLINKLKIDNNNRDDFWEFFISLTTSIFAHCFYVEDHEKYLTKLFKKDEVTERLSIILNHRNFSHDILGNDIKCFFNDWVSSQTSTNYSQKKQKPIEFKIDNNTKENEFNPEQVPHHKRKVYSIIDDPIWNKAKWKGFGMFGSPYEVGAFLAFENAEKGKAIFDGWIKKFGKDDKNDTIKVTIVKGIDRNNPFHYRVSISSNIDTANLQPSSIFISKSRFHEMTPNNGTNLEQLLKGYNYFKKYKLCPATVSDDGKKIVPFFDKFIIKHTIHIKNAWEIGVQDQDRILIHEDDTPIIPKDVKDAPILELLNKST